MRNRIPFHPLVHPPIYALYQDTSRKDMPGFHLDPKLVLGKILRYTKIRGGVKGRDVGGISEADRIYIKVNHTFYFLPCF